MPVNEVWWILDFFLFLFQRKRVQSGTDFYATFLFATEISPSKMFQP